MKFKKGDRVRISESVLAHCPHLIGTWRVLRWDQVGECYRIRREGVETAAGAFALRKVGG